MKHYHLCTICHDDMPCYDRCTPPEEGANYHPAPCDPCCSAYVHRPGAEHDGPRGESSTVTCPICIVELAHDVESALEEPFTLDEAVSIADSADLDMLAKGFHLTRHPGESDLALRIRVAAAVQRLKQSGMVRQ